MANAVRLQSKRKAQGEGTPFGGSYSVWRPTAKDLRYHLSNSLANSIPVVRSLIEWIEYFDVGVRGDILHTIYVVLLFDGFLHFNRFIVAHGFSNTAQFLAHPPLTFQLGCLLFCLEVSVVLVTFLLCWKYRSVIGATIDAQHLKALGLNPNPQHLKNLAYLAMTAAAGACTASIIGDIAQTFNGSHALESNRTIAENLQKDLVDKRIGADEYIQAIKSVAESNVEIGQTKSSNFAIKN